VRFQIGLRSISELFVDRRKVKLTLFQSQSKFFGIELAVREIQMVDDEDFPASYLLYAVAVIIAMAALVLSTFFIFFR
jgi:hypothetical protein